VNKNGVSGVFLKPYTALFDDLSAFRKKWPRIEKSTKEHCSPSCLKYVLNTEVLKEEQVTPLLLTCNTKSGVYNDRRIRTAKINLRLKSTKIPTVTEKHVHTISSLICDIGGSWGLFLGLSVMTIIDIVSDLLHRMGKVSRLLLIKYRLCFLSSIHILESLTLPI
jgi:hypothetical protein